MKAPVTASPSATGTGRTNLAHLSACMNQVIRNGIAPTIIGGRFKQSGRLDLVRTIKENGLTQQNANKVCGQHSPASRDMQLTVSTRRVFFSFFLALSWFWQSGIVASLPSGRREPSGTQTIQL